MTANRSWIKFWPQDWQRDPALRLCGLAARGLWMELICIAHEGTPYGHVTISGRTLTVAQIGKIAGTGEKEADRLLVELEEAGVFSRTEDGTIYSRRMTKDKEASEIGRQHVQRRWEKRSDPNKEEASSPNTEPIRGPIAPLLGGVIHLEERSKKQEYSLRETPSGVVDPKTDLWRDGLAILVRLTGKPEAPTRRVLGKLLDAVGADHERLLGLLRRAEIEQPSEPVPWLTAAAKRGTTQEPDLLEDDPWGLKRWAKVDPGAVEVEDGGKMVFAIGGYDAIAVGQMIAEVAGLSPAWRGSWAPLGQWLRDGIPSDEILAGVRRRAEWSEYTPPDNLTYFEKPVREAHARGTRQAMMGSR